MYLLKHLNDTWQAYSNIVNDRGVTYIFEYKLVTPSPNMIFYGLARNKTLLDSTSIGNPIDLNKVSVTINGVPADINVTGYVPVKCCYAHNPLFYRHLIVNSKFQRVGWVSRRRNPSKHQL